MKKIDRLMVQIRCFLREEKVKEILANMTPEEKKAHEARLLKADEALGRVLDRLE